MKIFLFIIAVLEFNIQYICLSSDKIYSVHDVTYNDNAHLAGKQVHISMFFHENITWCLDIFGIAAFVIHLHLLSLLHVIFLFPTLFICFLFFFNFCPQQLSGSHPNFLLWTLLFWDENKIWPLSFSFFIELYCWIHGNAFLSNNDGYKCFWVSHFWLKVLKGINSLSAPYFFTFNWKLWPRKPIPYMSLWFK